MNCPNKNIQEWKEMVSALGEDLSYYIWNENNGNPIHLAPNGKPSKLFNDLLELNNGDKIKAIQEKARVYSKEFKDFFGNWLSDNKENVSKVIDENGEPLIVYHNTVMPFAQYDFNKTTMPTKEGGTAIYLTGKENINVWKEYQEEGARRAFIHNKNWKEEDMKKFRREAISMPFYVNVKSLKVVDDIYLDWYDNGEERDKYDGKIAYDEEGYIEQLIVRNPNQIKSAILPTQEQKEEFDLEEDKIGKFSKESDNIYYQKTNKKLNRNDYIKEIKEILTDKKENNVTEVINKLLHNKNIKESQKIILEKIKDLIPKNIKIVKDDVTHYEQDEKGNYKIAYFDFKKREIHISYGVDYRTLIHELLHSVTWWTLRNNKNFNNYFNKIKKYFENIGITDKEFYGLTNSDEFISELFTNPNFMQLLKNHPALEYKNNRNIWEELWNLISKWLNIKQDNLLLEAMDKSIQLIEDLRDEAEIYNKNDYNEQNKEILNYINQEILENEETNDIQSVLRKIINQQSVYSPLAQQLLDTLEKNNLNIGLQLDEDLENTKDVGYYYDGENGEAIVLLPHNIDDKEYLYKVILHETVHFMTVRLLNNNEKIAKEFKDFFEKVKSTFTEQEQKEIYGLEDMYEFISELFTNIEFQNMLKEKPSIAGFKHKNLWQEIWEFIAKILNVKQNTLLEQAIAFSTHIVEKGSKKHNILPKSQSEHKLSKDIERILDYYGELHIEPEGKKRAKLHFNNDKEYEKLKKKVYEINYHPDNKKYIAYIAKKIEGKRRMREYISLGVRRMTDKERLYKRFGLLDIVNERNVVRNKLFVLNKNTIKKLEEIKHKINSSQYKYTASIIKYNNRVELRLDNNINRIKDLAKFIKTYNIPEYKDIESIKDNKYYKLMIKELGQDVANKIIELERRLLNKDEIKEFKNAYNDGTRAKDDYDDNKNIDNYDEEDYDEAISYSFDEYENTNELIDDMLQDIDIDYFTTIKTETIGDIYNKLEENLLLKVKARLDLYYDKMQKTKDREEKKNIAFDIRLLENIIDRIRHNNTNLWDLLGIIENDIKDTNEKLKQEGIDITNIEYYHSIINFWEMVIDDYSNNTTYAFYDYLSNNIQFQHALMNYKGILFEMKQKLLELDKKIFLEKANQISNIELTEDDVTKITEISNLTKEFRDLSETGNKIASTIYKFLNNAENAKMTRFNKFNKELEEWLEKLGKKYDFSKKEVQLLLLEKDNEGDLTGRLLSMTDIEYEEKKREIEKMRMRWNKAKTLRKNRKFIKRLKMLEEELFNLIDYNKLINENNQLDENKLNRLKELLINRYNETIANKFIKEAKNKWNKYLEDKESYRNWVYDKIMTDKNYLYIRKKEINETDEDVQKRVNMEVDKFVKIWEQNNSPIVYINNRSSNNYSYNRGYKYIVELPHEDYISRDYKRLEREHPELYQFYNWYIDKMNEMISYLPIQTRERLTENFLPKIQQDLLERLSNGNGLLKSIQQQWVDNTTVSEVNNYKRIDALGNDVKTIPIRYIGPSIFDLKQQLKDLYEKEKEILERIEDDEEYQQVKKEFERKREIIREKIRIQKEQQSTDLIKMIKAFSIMIENYKAYNQIENVVKTGKRVLDEIKNVKFNKRINQTSSKSDIAYINEGAKKIKEMADYAINALMYQEKKEHRMVSDRLFFKDEKLNNRYKELRKQAKKLQSKYTSGKIDKKEFLSKKREIDNKINELVEIQTPRILTTDSLSDTVVNITGMVQLGWNIKSALNNYLFGKISLMTHAYGEEDFTIEQLKQAFKILNKAYRGGSNSQNYQKIKNLSDLYNVVFEVNEAAYGAKSAFEEKTKKFDIIKSYGMVRYGEFYLQNATMIALLLSKKIRVKSKELGTEYEISLWDAYNSQGQFRNDIEYWNGKEYENKPSAWNEEIEVDKTNEYRNTLQRIEQINKIIHGNYDPRSPIKIKSKDYGRMLMQYKTWVPEGIAQRFENEIWDDMIGRYRKGRYRTAIELGIGKSLLILYKNLLNAKRLRNDLKGMESVDIANMMKNLYELRVYSILLLGQLSLRMLLQFINPDDDEWKIKILRQLINQLSRLTNDLSFYFNPENILNTIKRPMPTIQYLSNWLSWLYKSRKLWLPGYYSDSYTFTQWLWSGAKNFPFTNEIKKWINEAKKLNE